MKDERGRMTPRLLRREMEACPSLSLSSGQEVSNPTEGYESSGTALASGTSGSSFHVPRSSLTGEVGDSPGFPRRLKNMEPRPQPVSGVDVAAVVHLDVEIGRAHV